MSMKTALRISIWLNLALAGSVVFLLLTKQQKAETAPVPMASRNNPVAQAVVIHAPSKSPDRESKPFRWSQLESSKSYQAYVANLRAVGCPEPTIEDIVRGDAARAFAWERHQLGLGESGTGPWSRQAEMRLVASLLSEGQPSASAEAGASQGAENQMQEAGTDNLVANTAATVPSEANPAGNIGGNEIAATPVPSKRASATGPVYPLFLQDVNWRALGFTPSQQAAIAQVRERFLSDISGLNQTSASSANQNTSPANPNPDNSTPLKQWQKALLNAINQLRASLGTQGYMAYVQQQYINWYQPQVTAANAEGKPLTINPDEFSILQ